MGGWSVPRALLCPHGPISTQQTGLVKQMKRPCIKMGTSLLFPVRIVVFQESSEFLLLGQASVYPPNASLAVLFSSIYFGRTDKSGDKYRVMQRISSTTFQHESEASMT